MHGAPACNSLFFPLILERMTEQARYKIRRGRRLDFTAVMELLADGVRPAPPPDRASLRRFRRIAADLGSDLYVAETDGRPVGVLHVSYVRQLNSGQRARVEQLAVAEPHRGLGLERQLLDFAFARARRRACASLSWAPSAAGANAELPGAAGLLEGAREYGLDLQVAGS